MEKMPAKYYRKGDVKHPDKYDWTTIKIRTFFIIVYVKENYI